MDARVYEISESTARNTETLRMMMYFLGGYASLMMTVATLMITAISYNFQKDTTLQNRITSTISGVSANRKTLEIHDNILRDHEEKINSGALDRERIRHEKD